jgi:phosphonate transport system substrate-binding protein
MLLVVLLINTYTGAYAQPLQKIEEVRIGLVPEINIFKQKERYEYLKSYLTKKTGIKIRFSIVKNYGDIVDLFYGLELDGAFFGSLTALIANTKLEIEPVVRPVYAHGRSTCRGYILVRKESGIKDIENLRGMVIAFVDKASTTGYVFPVAYLKQNGVKSINKYFSGYFYAGSHDAAIKSVLKKEADITAVKESVYHALTDKDPKVANELMVIAKSIEFPTNALWLGKHLDAKTRRKIKKALIDMAKDEEGREILSLFGAKGFVETKISDYKNVFSILKKAGIEDLSTYDYFNK